MTDLSVRLLGPAYVVATGEDPYPKFEVCPHCHALITTGRYEDHTAVTHPGRTSGGTT